MHMTCYIFSSLLKKIKSDISVWCSLAKLKCFQVLASYTVVHVLIYTEDDFSARVPRVIFSCMQYVVSNLHLLVELIPV